MGQNSLRPRRGRRRRHRQDDGPLTSLYLDTEFNGFGGELISLALFNPVGASWYEVRCLPQHPHPFAASHVIPVLGKQPLGHKPFLWSLRSYLKGIGDFEVTADLAEDLAHFLACICRDEDWSYSLSFRAVLLPNGPGRSETPHNALSDAKALAEWVAGSRR